MTPKEIAEKVGCTERTIYNKAKKLGRLPTIEEARKIKGGRPRKYKTKEECENARSNVDM